MGFQRKNVLKAYFTKGINFSTFLSNQDFVAIRLWPASSLFVQNSQNTHVRFLVIFFFFFPIIS